MRLSIRNHATNDNRRPTAKRTALPNMRKRSKAREMATQNMQGGNSGALNLLNGVEYEKNGLRNVNNGYKNGHLKPCADGHLKVCTKITFNYIFP